jgi:hypothetical protein
MPCISPPTQAMGMPAKCEEGFERGIPALAKELKLHDHIIGFELSQSIWVEVKKRGAGNRLPPLKTPISKSTQG